MLCLKLSYKSNFVDVYDLFRFSTHLFVMMSLSSQRLKLKEEIIKHIEFKADSNVIPQQQIQKKKSFHKDRSKI